MTVKKCVELAFDFGGNFDAEDEFAQWVKDGGIASDLSNAAADGARRFILEDQQWDGKRPRVTGEPDVFRRLMGVIELEDPINLRENVQVLAVEFFGGPRCSVKLKFRDASVFPVQQATYDLRIGEFVEDWGFELEPSRALKNEILPDWARSELRWR